MKRIIIFASGSGTNTQNIIEYFQQNKIAKVVLVLSNKEDAKVLERANTLNIPFLSFTKADLCTSNKVLDVLKKEMPDLIVLAGFLLKFPENILQVYPNKVINIHPALLPKYGGKGMYGSFEVFYVPAPRFRTRISSIKWGKWWEGPLPNIN